MARSALLVPALIRFSGGLCREDAWGRLLSLCASTAELCTQTPLQGGQAIRLCFEVNGEGFEDVRARVEDAVKDADGFCRAEVRFEDEVEKRRLARALSDLLSRDIS